MYNFYFLGALGQAVHQAVSKKRPKSPKLDIPFALKNYNFPSDRWTKMLPTRDLRQDLEVAGSP
jgi:hypothetical protein